MSYRFIIRIWSPTTDGSARKQLAQLIHTCTSEEEAQAQAGRLQALVQDPIGKVEVLLPWSEEWRKGKAEGRFQAKGRQRQGAGGTEFIKA